MKTLLFFMLIQSISFALTIPRKQTDNELTVLGITLGKSTMEEVKQKFRATEDIYQESEAKGITYTLCFRGPGNSTLTFSSDELGGDKHIVNAVAINGPAEPYRLQKICQKPQLKLDKPSIAGLSLGMSPDLIKARLGKPSSFSNKAMGYEFNVAEKEKDISSSLDIVFHQNAAAAIKAYKMSVH